MTVAWPGALRNGRFVSADDNRARFYLNGGFSF